MAWALHSAISVPTIIKFLGGQGFRRWIKQPPKNLTGRDANLLIGKVFLRSRAPLKDLDLFTNNSS
jgi:hypothetical protein